MREARMLLSLEEVTLAMIVLERLCVMVLSLSPTLSFCLSRQDQGHTTTLGLSGLGTVLLVQTFAGSDTRC